MPSERPIDSRIVKATNEYRKALDKLSTAQDPCIKEILRSEAIQKLENAAIVTEAVEMQEKQNLSRPCKN